MDNLCTFIQKPKQGLDIGKCKQIDTDLVSGLEIESIIEEKTVFY